MNVKYHKIRKVNSPLSKDSIREFYNQIDEIKCGYLEVMLQYGPGNLAGEIVIIHPKSIKSATENTKEYLQRDADIPHGVSEDWFNKFIVLGAGNGRRYILYLPEMGEKFLIYDGDFDRLFVNPWGFSDPRYGFNNGKMYYGRDYELIFDSGLNTKAIQVVRRDDSAVRTMDIAGAAIERWFVPGDMIRGDLHSQGFSILYLSKLGGYIHITNERHYSIVDMITISFDVSETVSVDNFLNIFGSGYEINRF